MEEIPIPKYRSSLQSGTCPVHPGAYTLRTGLPQFEEGDTAETPGSVPLSQASDAFTSLVTGKSQGGQFHKTTLKFP